MGYASLVSRFSDPLIVVHFWNSSVRISLDLLPPPVTTDTTACPRTKRLRHYTVSQERSGMIPTHNLGWVASSRKLGVTMNL